MKSAIKISEADIQGFAIDLAKQTGKWMVHHGRPARTANGWATAITGHRGFPDVVFVSAHHGLVLFAEFKSEKGRIGQGQPQWAEAISAVSDVAPNVLYRLWRPSDRPEIEQLLKNGVR